MLLNLTFSLKGQKRLLRVVLSIILKFYSIMSITTKKESSSSRVETTTNEVLADSSVQEVISSDLALNLVMGADWMFRQMFSFHDVLKIHDLLKLRSFCKLFKI